MKYSIKFVTFNREVKILNFIFAMIFQSDLNLNMLGKLSLQ